MQEGAVLLRVAQLPEKPGVYIMKDQAGTVIYVGKAVNLRSRVRSYFQAGAHHTPKVRQLVAQVADVDFIVTASELEALILECTLIKRYRPRYNVRLKDEKRYPFIRVGLNEEYPTVRVVRRMQQDGARYFGPYTSSWAMRETLELLRRLFPYRTCNDALNGKNLRACLYYHIGRCCGPCVGAVTKEEYREMIAQLCLFLEGKGAQVLAQLRKQMEQAAQELRFERAAALRDQIQAVEQVVERQRVVSETLQDHDVIAMARADGSACVQVFFIRQGHLIGREYFVLEGTSDEDGRVILASFLQQFYSEAGHIPEEVILPEMPESASVIQQWLRQRRGRKVQIRVPARGEKKQLLALAMENAEATLAALRAEWEADEGRAVAALEDLRAVLGLSAIPARIECFDVSNTQGTNPVGSMVVFVKGVPKRSDYRHFRIRTVLGANDYAMMREVLERRFAELAKPQQEDVSFACQPDLVVVDGGAGHLGVALEVLRAVGLESIPAIGLAKENESLFVPGRSEPLLLERARPALRLLQRIRDEAHRFAIGYHRRLRSRSSRHSVLEEIPGIGPKRRRALLREFGSIEAIRAASVEQLASVPGMTRSAAQSLKRALEEVT